MRVPSLGQEAPWRRARQPTPGFLPGESHGQGSLASCSPWGHKESDTTEHPNTHIRECSSWRSLEVLCFLRHRRKVALMAFSGKSSQQGRRARNPYPNKPLEIS